MQQGRGPMGPGPGGPPLGGPHGGPPMDHRGGQIIISYVKTVKRAGLKLCFVSRG